MLMLQAEKGCTSELERERGEGRFRANRQGTVSAKRRRRPGSIENGGVKPTAVDKAGEAGRRPEGRRNGAPSASAGEESTLALQGALLEHGPGPAMILVILALIGASGTVRIRRSSLEAFDKPMRCPAVQAVFAKYRRRFAGCLEPGGAGGPSLRLRYWDPACQARAFEALCAMDRCEIHELFTALVASTLAGAPGRKASVDDTPLAAALPASWARTPREAGWAQSNVVPIHDQSTNHSALIFTH